MDIFKFSMLILYTMVHNIVPASSSGNSSGEENKKIDVEIEHKTLPTVPPGFRFVPSPCQLILDFLVKKIVGVPLASDLVKVRDGIQQLDPEQHRFGKFWFIYLFKLPFS